jgi:hypothetical protein
MSQVFFFGRKIREGSDLKKYQVASIKYQEIRYEVPRRLYEVLSTRYQDLFGGESKFQSGSPLQHAAFGVHHSTLNRYQVTSSTKAVRSTRRGLPTVGRRARSVK